MASSPSRIKKAVEWCSYLVLVLCLMRSLALILSQYWVLITVTAAGVCIITGGWTHVFVFASPVLYHRTVPSSQLSLQMAENCAAVPAVSPNGRGLLCLLRPLFLLHMTAPSSVSRQVQILACWVIVAQRSPECTVRRRSACTYVPHSEVGLPLRKTIVLGRTGSWTGTWI